MSKKLLEQYRAAARKFVHKVETGRAYSKETYAELLACLKEHEKEDQQKDQEVKE